ncbi:MAG: CYTH domain-containing protein [Oscillospiraceae bacterium]|nr:CYTH domain-containing protein [Oscillospiraceae bacterium]
MGKETEYKLEVGDLQLLDCILCSEPVASRMQAPFAYIRMQTTYYDTEDGLLEKNRWMLRLRTENERSVVTMKTPGEGHTRGEWEVESEYLDEALPELAKLGAPEAIGRLDAEALLPVCGAKFTRITAPLRLSEKTSCTLCGDLGELTGGGKKALLCELELELQAGEETDVQAFAKTLAERFHLHEQPRSKLQRARALTQ